MVNCRRRKARKARTTPSQRMRGMLPEERPSKIPHLPTEIISKVLGYTKKSDLKSTRLVSKYWGSLSIPFLFDTVYISPRNYDLEVFSNVTKHPVLRKAVTNLTWDTSRFYGAWDLRNYFEHLIFNIRFLSDSKIQEPSNSFHTFINDLRNIYLDSDTHFSKYQLETFVTEGYQTWQTLAAEEDSLLDSGRFYAALINGLRQLSRLRSVNVSSRLWNNLRDEPWTPTINGNAIGTPLIRCWDPRFAPPSDEVSTQATAEFVALGGLELYSLNHFPQVNQCEPAVSAYRNLTSFQIKLRISDLDKFDSSKPVKLLPTLLRSMSKLKELTIEMDSWQQLPGNVSPNSYDYRLIIPQAGQWPCMTYFKLVGANIGGFHLFKLLKARMPILRHLELKAINLTDWNWDGVFEGTRYLEGLKTIRLPSKQGYLRHRGGRHYPHRPDDETRGDQNQTYKFLRNMEDYVICGGRHPNLTPESEPRDADRFLDEFLQRFKIAERCSRHDTIARHKRNWSISDKIGIASDEDAMIGEI